MLTAKRAGLSGTALKTIALVLMVLDHIHYFSSSLALYRNGSAWWHGYPHRCFVLRSRVSPTRMTKRYFLRIWAIATAMGTVTEFL